LELGFFIIKKTTRNMARIPTESSLKHIQSIMSDVVDVSDFFQSGAKTMRMRPGVDAKVSIIDFVMATTGHGKNIAGKTIKRMTRAHTIFFESIEQYQFPGRGEREQFVLGAEQAMEVLMMLPGKAAKLFRRHCAGLIVKLFAGDPTLHDLLNQYNLVADATQSFCAFLEGAAPAIMAAVDHDKDDAHDLCKVWIADNLDNISFVTEICPRCKNPTVGLSLTGGVALVEEIIPHTAYRADVLVQLPDSTTIAIEVAHTHFTSGKRMFECEEAGTMTCEVETCEIQSAMLNHSTFHVLRTTRTRSVQCADCVIE
jgi:hypothetical protein